MAREYLRVSVAGSNSAYSDVAVVDKTSKKVIALSLVGNDTLLFNIEDEIKNSRSGTYATIYGVATYDIGRNCTFTKKRYEDFSHLIIKQDDFIEEDKEIIHYTFYILYRNEEELYSYLYDKLYDNVRIPILKEWIPYIYKELNNRTIDLFVISEEDTDIKGNKIYLTNKILEEIVEKGLRYNEISLYKKTSNTMLNDINGLDDYLNTFSDTLAKKIEGSFIPKFIPGKDSFDEYVDNFDDSCYWAGLNIYHAQKSVIQSVVKNMDTNKTSFIIGEMGVGKTLLACGSLYSHYKKAAGMTSMVLCPTHILEKWKREIEKLIPNSEAVIIYTLADVLELEDRMRDKNKDKHLFLIISKEMARIDYDCRPSVVYSKCNNAYVCPKCGQKLFKTEKVDGIKFKINLNDFDFAKPNSNNEICKNQVLVYDTKTKTHRYEICGERLWTPVNKADQSINWIKLGASGWFYKMNLGTVYNDTVRRLASFKNDKKAKVLKKAIEEYRETPGKYEFKVSLSRRYSISKYIKERINGVIDYLVVDEMHEYKNANTAQGDAMADLAQASNKILGLTGTLLDGYATGLFYLLYRTMPSTMSKKKYNYDYSMDFQKKYGVVKYTECFNLSNNKRGTKISGGNKAVPGVSPLLFTDFLLENAVFVSISDMAEGLPDYEEVPVPVEMDSDLREKYEIILEASRGLLNPNNEVAGPKIMSQVLQMLSIYPDMPYNCEPIVSPENGELVYQPESLNEGLRNKELALLELIEERLANNEKVLVYYEFTNTTDVADKIMIALKERNIKALNLTSSTVKAINREKWVEDNFTHGDAQVLICNPNLVKTGLDLLEFTSIIFYQMRYNVFTLRQASRRSYRLNQTKDIKVYFMYYKDTVQEQALTLMASKLQASLALEGKFSEEGLRAMAENEDILSKVASSVVNGIQDKLDVELFKKNSNISTKHIEVSIDRERKTMDELLLKTRIRKQLGYLIRNNIRNTNNNVANNILNGKLGIDTIYLAYI